MREEAFYEAAQLLPPVLAARLLAVPETLARQVTELRLRQGRPVLLQTPAQSVPLDGAFLSGQLLQECFYALCGYSIHSMQPYIDDGFLPVPGGHRAGVCGTAFYRDDGSLGVRDITSINLRLARTRLLALPPGLEAAMHGAGTGLLLAGEPGSGKTTLLRAVAAALSASGCDVSVIDERGEVFPAAGKAPLRCDVFSGYPKHVAMIQALRAMAPAVLICDELGTMEDTRAVLAAANAGVGLVATLHAGSREQLLRRPQYRALLQTGAFTDVAFLKGRAAPGQVERIEHVDAVL